jgi:glucose/arabinose dehydrogenase
MRRALTTVLVLGLLLAAATPARAAVGAQQVLGGLDFPAAFTFAPSGKLFYAERFNGEIHIYNPATGGDRVFHTIPNIATAGEQGLLGLALHPQYPVKPFVFAFYSHPSDENRIVRIRNASGTGVRRRTILTVPMNGNHNGGVIHFGPDGHLYAVVGDSGDPANSQDLDSRAGKVLRMTGLGRVPADNSIPGNYTYSFGHRNMFGFAWDPETGNLWVTENGPNCNDEINLSVPLGNFAWGPTWSCEGSSPGNTNQDGPEPRLLPETWYGPPMIAPTGAAFCDGCGLAGQEGHLVFGSWGGGGLLRSLTLDTERDDVSSESVLYDHSSGILAVERAPDGRLYFSDSDQIFRLVQP